MLFCLLNYLPVQVGHGSRDDANLLLMDYFINVRSVFDTNPFSRNLGLSMNSLRGLAGIMLGLQLSKAMSRSNWMKRELTEEQLTYASTDAWISLEVYKALMK